jgi:hypothetical protein
MMAQLKNFDRRKTLAYRFSVDNKEDGQLIKLKQLIKDNNKWARIPQRVRLMARGGKRGSFYSTPHANATYFDVYVHERG